MGKGIVFTMDAAISLIILIFFSFILYTLLVYQEQSRFENINAKMTTYLLSLKQTGELEKIARRMIEGKPITNELRKILRRFTAGNGRVCVFLWGVGQQCYPKPPLNAKYTSQITFHSGYYYGVIRLEIE